jgi:hypothetical protein
MPLLTKFQKLSKKYSSGRMYRTLNIDKKITNGTSVNVETNLLSLVSPWLNKFYQTTTKVL